MYVEVTVSDVLCPQFPAAQTHFAAKQSSVVSMASPSPRAVILVLSDWNRTMLLKRHYTGEGELWRSLEGCIEGVANWLFRSRGMTLLALGPASANSASDDLAKFCAAPVILMSCRMACTIIGCVHTVVFGQT